jgi:hypothetical protein
MFGNRTLQKMFGPQRGEVTINWRQLHNKEFHELYFWHNTRTLRAGEVGGTCSRHLSGEKRNAYRVSCGNLRKGITSKTCKVTYHLGNLHKILSWWRKWKSTKYETSNHVFSHSKLHLKGALSQTYVIISWATVGFVDLPLLSLESVMSLTSVLIPGNIKIQKQETLPITKSSAVSQYRNIG